MQHICSEIMNGQWSNGDWFSCIKKQIDDRWIMSTRRFIMVISILGTLLAKIFFVSLSLRYLVWGSSQKIYFYCRPASPAWIIKSTRLHTGKQIASFKHENWLSKRVPHKTEHLSSSVYSTLKKITFPTCKLSLDDY